MPARLHVSENVSLASMTTLGVGGDARYFARVTSEAQVRAAVAWADARNLPWTVLGGGSNVVVADEGIDGLVLQPDLRGWEVDDSSGRVRLRVGAGESWDSLVALAVERGWGGVECLSAIPGTVGAAPIQNIGAYGQEVCETIVEVRALDTVRDEPCTLPADACGFGYRTSRFRSGDMSRAVVVAVAFELRADARATVRYAELAQLLSRQSPPNLCEVREAVFALRRRKSMVAEPGDPYARSAGSFFVNPVVDDQEYAELVVRARSRGWIGAREEPPHHEAGEMKKLSAAWLIERAGFCRGFERGAVGLSPHHALAIINRGGATARDVIALARDVQAAVGEQCGVVLKAEPVFLGLSPEILASLTP